MVRHSNTKAELHKQHKTKLDSNIREYEAWMTEIKKKTEKKTTTRKED
jgi:uncharacterized protein YgiM (DUF1202 family)